ncbi:hypothetical protein WN66_03298 [Saccharomyces cerevisiae]|nr:hypothetical protein WN66_03298 [Saccharomyces cerevisiae]
MEGFSFNETLMGVNSHQKVSMNSGLQTAASKRAFSLVEVTYTPWHFAYSRCSRMFDCSLQLKSTRSDRSLSIETRFVILGDTPRIDMIFSVANSVSTGSKLIFCLLSVANVLSKGIFCQSTKLVLNLSSTVILQKENESFVRKTLNKLTLPSSTRRPLNCSKMPHRETKKFLNGVFLVSYHSFLLPRIIDNDFRVLKFALRQYKSIAGITDLVIFFGDIFRVTTDIQYQPILPLLLVSHLNFAV